MSKIMKFINLLKKNQCSFRRMFFGTILILFLMLPLSTYAAIPKSGNIAVAVDAKTRRDATTYQIESAEAMIVQELIRRGYRPVDERVMTQIRHQKAQWFAAVDDVAAIKRLSSQYGVHTTITAYLATSQEMDSYVGIVIRTSMTVRAISSDGIHLYGGNIDDERLVRERDRVRGARESMQTVVRRAVDEMTR